MMQAAIGIERETGELRSLTSLRGIAAMAVVMQHFSATAQQHSYVNIPSLVPHGYVAVDFFFVLSGFIMSYTYLSGFQQQGLRAYGSFLAKRVARVVPLNVVTLIVLVLAGGLSSLLVGRNIFFESRDIAFDLGANLLMLQGLGVGTNLNGPSWSISTEFAAYFLFPVFVMAVFGQRVRPWFAAVGAIAALCWLASLQPRLGMTADGPPASLVRCFAEFILGMTAYQLFLTARATDILKRDSVTIILSLAAAASLVAGYDLPAVLLFPLIVVAFAVNDGWAARIMQLRLFYFLGIISFSLYLLHGPFRPLELELLRLLAPEPVGPVVALVFAFVGSCSIVPVAWLAYVGVERPGRTLVRALFDRGATRPLRPGFDPSS